MLRRAFGVLVVACLLVWLTAGWWLPAMGAYLVQAEPPRHADGILVLGGDLWGDRLLHAARLAREGYAPKVYVSGPEGIFDFYESDVAIDYAKRKGFTDIQFVSLQNRCKSTQEEAEQLLPRLRQAGVRTLLVVTSNYHTRRAGSVMRAHADGLEITMIAAKTREFDPTDWWTKRQEQKTLFFEWAKTVAGWFGL